MADYEVKVKVSDDEAKRQLDKFKAEADRASDVLDEAERKASSTSRRPAARSQTSGAGSAAKAAAAAAAVVVAARVAEVVTSAISQELDKRGFGFLAEQFDALSQQITSVTSIATKLQAAVSTVANVARPFAESGLPLPPGALYGAAKIGWERAQREAEAERRRTGRTAKLYKDTVADLLRFFT